MKKIVGALTVSVVVLLMVSPVSTHVNKSIVNTPSIRLADGSMPPPPFPPRQLPLLNADGSMPPPPFPPPQPPQLRADGSMPPPPFPPHQPAWMMDRVGKQLSPSLPSQPLGGAAQRV